MLQSSQTNAEGHHVDEGITGQLLSPGGGIGQEVAADDLHQNAEAEACIEDGTQGVQDLHVDLDEFITYYKSNMFTVSGMAFMDLSNLDAERLKRCRVVQLTDDDRLIPFCAYNSIYRK